MSIVEKFCHWAPNHISNRTVLRFFEFFRFFQKWNRRNDGVHFQVNRIFFNMHKTCINEHKGYIENQNDYKDMIFGKSTVQYSGCEIIAVYNALNFLFGKEMYDLAELISEFETDGMIFSGKFGTSPKALQQFLKKHGFITKLSWKESEFDELANTVKAMILTVYNDRENLLKEVHTVFVHKTEESYFAHNAYCNGVVIGPYKSVSDLLGHMNKGKAKGISLIAIQGLGEK